MAGGVHVPNPAIVKSADGLTSVVNVIDDRSKIVRELDSPTATAIARLSLDVSHRE
jgi:hypothetical protein